MSSSGRAGEPSRSQEAFGWLLSSDNDDDAGHGRKGGSRAGGDRRKGKGKGGGRSGSGSGGGGSGSKPHAYIPGFQLRDNATAAAAAASGSAGTTALDLTSLQGAFEGVFPPELVADALSSCSGDPSTAMEALLTMAGTASSSDAAPQAAEASADAQRAATTVAGPLSGGAVPPPTAPCFWDELPPECKWLVFEQLSLRDLACAARVCREFAAHAHEQRRSLRTVVVPEGVSLTAVHGLVAAFRGARCVALWRCAPKLRFQHEFEDMLRAVALGEADRSSGVPVSQLCLARCGAASDGVVAMLCDTFAHLRRLDLARCADVSDAAMTYLSAYTRQAVPANSSKENKGEEREAAGYEAAAAAAVGSMQLSAPPPSLPLPAALPAAPAMESPDSAVRRIAAQRHADMLARSAAAAHAQHGQRSSHGLEELCLKETSVGGRGIRQLLQPGSATSKSLRVLDVSRCANLGSDMDLHPRAVLEVLRASGCTSLHTVVIQLPPEAPLRNLCLDGCRQLLEVTVVASWLQALNVSHCGQLRSLSLRCKRLRELRAINCTNLSLSAGLLHCPALDEVNLFGCRQLNADGLEAAAASLAKCTSLDLTGCINLSRVLLPEAIALRTVSVSGCSQLRQVLLSSPALSQFKAAGCSRLMDLRLGTASLAALDLENCGHLREVQLSEDVGGAVPRDVPGSEGAWAEQLSCSGRGGSQAAVPRHKALVLKGCAALSDDAKACLRAAVLGL